MIFEFANDGTLRQHLVQHFHSLTWEDKYKLSVEITNGLRYMHKLNIIQGLGNIKYVILVMYK